MSFRGKILVIDDDLTASTPVLDYLKDAGFEVQHVPNGGRGVQVALKSKPDLVLCDMLMPGMNGLEVLKLIKAEIPQMVVIMLSGIQEEETAKAALNAGAHSFLTKPVSFDNLKRNVIDRFFI